MSLFAAWRKKELVKKGFACRKSRRRQSNNELLRSLETSGQVKTLVFFLFAAGLAGLVFYGQQPDQAKRYLFVLLVFLTALVQLWINHPLTFGKNSRLGLLFGACFVHLLLVKIIHFLASDPSGVSGRIISERFVFLLFPYALAPLVISVLLGRNPAIFAAIYLSLWGAALWRTVDAPFLAMSLITGFVTVFVTREVRRRGQLLRAGVLVGATTWLLALSFGIIELNWVSFAATDWQLVGEQSAAAFGASLFVAILVSGLLPVLESLFRVTTDVSWLEMADLNHPLLKRLSLEAPGTYHHSQEVARLAEAAAEAIGANALMCQTCSYFHDIGKLVKPDYFTENQPLDGKNPHDDLAPTMSALIIIAHVKEGVDLALKYKLNSQIIDVIQQHHGNSLIYYFYKRALQQQEDARLGGKITRMREEDIPEVREENFRYPGPLPQTKECAIISLADAIQSASRSLEKPTPQRIEQLVNDIVDNRVADHQLDACDLSFRELQEVAESFKFTLGSMLHRRIAYPKQETTVSAAAGGTSAYTTAGSGTAIVEGRERRRGGGNHGGATSGKPTGAVSNGSSNNNGHGAATGSGREASPAVVAKLAASS
ncbi:MAG: HDIG domain-containing protein [Verrucomicrobia bacterium]|nr:HDIG domain-containing protein [Verrucomicrobiota bacterium]